MAENTDDMTVEEVKEAVKGMDEEEAQALLEREKSGKNRAGAIDAIESHLAKKEEGDESEEGQQAQPAEEGGEGTSDADIQRLGPAGRAVRTALPPSVDDEEATRLAASDPAAIQPYSLKRKAGVYTKRGDDGRLHQVRQVKTR